MKQYLDVMRDILERGVQRDDRTGTGTLAIFGTQARYDLSGGEFPLLTTKKLFLRGIIEELLWIISGSPDIGVLEEKDVKIWSPWKDPTGKKYPPYGPMWRNWPGGVDQLKQVIEGIKENPTSRRLIVSAWNPALLDEFVLPPCHSFFQFFVRGDRLDLQLYQRSADWFLGVPFNIASYSLLLLMVAQVVGLRPGEFIHTTGDSHLYLNCLSQAREQLGREPRKLPKMTLNPGVSEIEDFKYEDFTLTEYDPWPHIKADVAV